MREPIVGIGTALALCACAVLVLPREVIAQEVVARNLAAQAAFAPEGLARGEIAPDVLAAALAAEGAGAEEVLEEETEPQDHRRIVRPAATAAVVFSTIGWKIPLIGWAFVGAVQITVVIALVWLWVTDQIRTTPDGEVDGTIAYQPDDDYRQVPRVEVTPPPQLTSDPQIEPASVGDANDVLRELTLLVAQSRAFGTALARLYTALVRGEPEFADVQRVFLRDLLLPAIGETTRRADGAVERLMGGYRDVTVTREDVQGYLRVQIEEGYPEGEEPFLTMIAASDCERMHGEMALMEARLDQEEYSVVEDALPAIREFLELLPPFLSGYDLNPPVEALRAVNGCGVFRRGDSDDSGSVAIGDAISIGNYLFLGSTLPVCLEASDTNDDGGIDVSDPIYLLGWLFLGTDSPPAPGPHHCAWDPGDSPRYLGCASEARCK